MASTTTEPKYDANKADDSDEGAFAEHDSRDFDEKNDASLNPPVENAPKSNGPATPADSAPPVTDVIPELCATSADPKFRGHSNLFVHDICILKLCILVISMKIEVQVPVPLMFLPNGDCTSPSNFDFADMITIRSQNVSVQYSEEALVVKIDLPGEDLYDTNFRLFRKIIPSKSRYNILSTKLEIRLAIAEALHWNSLTSPEEKAVDQKMNTSSAALGPASSVYKSGAYWDKLEAEVKKEEEEEMLQGSDGVGQFLQDAYKNNTEDDQRAMNKSFVESNGTFLLADWEEVSAKKTEGTGP